MIAGLVLAAGASSRMGRPKIGLDVAGRPMVVRVVDAALDAFLTEVVVVVPVVPQAGGPDPDAPWHSTQAALRMLERRDRVRLVTNPDAAAGQSSSLRVGLAAMRPQTDAAVVLLADQPLIRTDAVRAVCDAFTPTSARIVQAAYGGRPAHPTLLARAIWPSLIALTGDTGARDVIATHPQWRSLVEVGGAPPGDVDTDADYERLLRDHPIPTD